MPDIELPQVLKDAPGMRAAELVVDGLSVFRFNLDTAENFWEIGYPRRGGHDLTITIQELDGDGNKVGDAVSHAVDRRVERFTLRLTNGSLDHYGLFPAGGPKAPVFHRDPAVDDPHDLQWMVDLAGDEIRHGEFLGLKPRHPGRPRSIASIRHSLFCNLEPEEKPARISPRVHDHPDGEDHFDLGQTNTFIVGVMLGRGSGNIEFEFDPDVTKIDPLAYNADKRYRIEIINNDTNNPNTVGSFVRGDLRLFYDELINVSGPEQDLWALPNTHRKEVSPDGDCHPTVSGGGTLLP